MPDWVRYVRENLPLEELKDQRGERIVREVAAQLEDFYLEALGRGMGEAEAEVWALGQIPDWSELAAGLSEVQGRHREPSFERWVERAETRARERGRRLAGLADLSQDVRFALRSLRRNPLFSGIAIAVLALGLGGAITIYTLVDGVLLKPLPFRQPDRLLVLWEKLASFDNASVAYPNFADWRAQNQVFEDLAAWRTTSGNLIGEGDPIVVRAGQVSASMFPILGVEPVLGRNFRPAEDEVDADPVVILTWRFWQDRFAGATDVVGRSMNVDGLPFTIVGVLPRTFTFPYNIDADAFAPIGLFAANWLQNRGNHPGISVIGRLRTGVTLEQARAEMERVALTLEAEHPDTNVGSRVNLAALHERISRDQRGPLLLMFLAVALLLLIAGANVANLMLARVTARHRELAVRATLGAGGGRLVRLLLVESLTLWLIGGAAGLLIALGGTRLLTNLMGNTLPQVLLVQVDLRVILAALVIALVTGLFFGLVPALRSARRDLLNQLKEGGRTTAGRSRRRIRMALVVAEVALAVALLVGAGLTVRSFHRMTCGEVGLDTENVLTLQVDLAEARYREPERRQAFFDGLLARVRAIPGVVSAATCYVVPLGPDNWQNGYHVEGEPPEEGNVLAYAETNAVSPDYFRTLEIPLVRGRDFTDRDGRAGTPPVVIVDEQLAQRYWPDEDPIGKRLKFGDFSSTNPWMEVVGVARHVALYGVLESSDWQLYLPHPQDNDYGYFLTVKTQGEPERYTESVRAAVLDLDGDQPIHRVRTMTDYLRASTERSGLLARLLALFAVAGLLLASAGLYGVMSYVTLERSHEIGIRIALGARRGQVLGMILRQGLGQVGVGVGVGLVLAAVFARILESGLYGIAPLDPVTFLLAPGFLVLVAGLAILVPAHRATRIDPVRVLQVT